MANYDFQKDLSVAKKTESEVADILRTLYGAKRLDTENTNKYDMLVEMKGEKITIEVKEDFLCENTGNVGLEFECRGKPSGIAVSQADFYIYKIHTKDFGVQFVVFKTFILKEMVAKKLYFRIVNGGDEGSNSMNYLFRYNEFVKHGKILRA